MKSYKVCILTVSDRCFKGESVDKSSPALQTLLTGLETENVRYAIVGTGLVPDSVESIQIQVRSWIEQKVNLILTTGGTGFGVRDLTPEAIEPLLERKAPNLTLGMQLAGLQKTPLALLSRGVCGTAGNSLLVTLPGSPKGCVENLQGIMNLIPHALDLLTGDSGEKFHKQINEIKSGDNDNKIEVAQQTAFNEGCRCHHSEDVEENNDQPKDLGPVAFRARKSPYPMLPFAEALERIAEVCKAIPTEQVDLTLSSEIFEHVLAEDIVARSDVPNLDVSIVDGYAVRSTYKSGVFEVQRQVGLAGPVDSIYKLEENMVARVTTGGPLPEGTDAVVMVEDTELVESDDNGNLELKVRISMDGIKKLSNVRVKGSDIQVGTQLMRSGDQLNNQLPIELGLLASAHIRQVKVFRKPVVGVLSTGNELFDLDQDFSTMKLGQAVDTNRPTLIHLIHKLGFKAVDLGSVSDDYTALKTKVLQALQEVDVLVTSGGVSMGEKDLVTKLLATEPNFQLRFARVQLKPGKPTTFATYHHPDQSEKVKLVFGLPGNPVSASVTFYLFVRPALLKLAGGTADEKKVQVRLSHRLEMDSRPEFHRCRVHFDLDSKCYLASSTGDQRSSRLRSVFQANALLQLPPKTALKSHLEPGDWVEALLF